MPNDEILNNLVVMGAAEVALEGADVDDIEVEGINYCCQPLHINDVVVDDTDAEHLTVRRLPPSQIERSSKQRKAGHSSHLQV